MDKAAVLPVGTYVKIKPLIPPGHVRAPMYLRGKVGVIERVLSAFENPEQRAYRQPARPVQLYRVRFEMREIWGQAAEHPEDTLDAEIYAHWIEPLETYHAA